jgi:hypothetical protein
MTLKFGFYKLPAGSISDSAKKDTMTEWNKTATRTLLSWGEEEEAEEEEEDDAPKLVKEKVEFADLVGDRVKGLLWARRRPLWWYSKGSLVEAVK